MTGIGIGEVPSEEEVREVWSKTMAWAYEPKTEDELSLEKTAEELAGEAFDGFIRRRIHEAFLPLHVGLQTIADRGYILD